jgi:hypothetical protein
MPVFFLPEDVIERKVGNKTPGSGSERVYYDRNSSAGTRADAFQDVSDAIIVIDLTNPKEVEPQCGVAG